MSAKTSLLAVALLAACAPKPNDGITGRVVWNADGCAFLIPDSLARQPVRVPDADRPECKAKAVRR